MKNKETSIKKEKNKQKLGADVFLKLIEKAFPNIEQQQQNAFEGYN